MNRGCAVLVFGLIAACGAGAARPRADLAQARSVSVVVSTPIASASPPPPDRFVLVRLSAALHSAPSTRAVVVPGRPDMDEFRSPFRFVADRGDFLELETVDDQPHCAFQLGFWNLRVHVFVTPDAIAPVVTRPIEVRVGEESTISLTAGVPVGPLVDGHRLVETNGFRFWLDVPEDAVGTSYPTVVPFRLSDQPTSVAQPVPKLLADGSELDGSAAPTGIYAVRPFGHDRLVELRGTCVRVEAVVRASAIERGFGGSLGPTKRRRQRRDVWRAPPSAPVFWADGRNAGFVEPASVGVALPGEGTVRDGRRCYDAKRGEVDAFRTDPSPVHQLCFDPKTLARWPSHAPETETSAIGPDTRRYVVVTVTERAPAPDGGVRRAVRATILDTLLVAKGFAVAPAAEDAATSARIAADKKLDGYRIEVEVTSLTRTRGSRQGTIENSGAANLHGRVRVVRLATGTVVFDRPLGHGRSLWLGEETMSDFDLVKSMLDDGWDDVRDAMNPIQPTASR